LSHWLPLENQTRWPSKSWTKSPDDRTRVLGIAAALANKVQTNRGLLASNDFAKKLAEVIRDDPAMTVRERAAIILMNGYSQDTLNKNADVIKEGVARHAGSLSLKEKELYGLLDSVNLADIRDLVGPAKATDGQPNLWACSLLARHGDRDAEGALVTALSKCPGVGGDSSQDLSCERILHLVQYAATDTMVRYMAERIFTTDTYVEGAYELPQSRGLIYALTIANIMRDRRDFPYNESHGPAGKPQIIVANWCSEHLGIQYPELRKRPAK